MKQKKFTRDEILSAIYEKVGTLDELAKLIGGTKQNISDKIKRQSPKFLNQLRGIGINITGALTQNYRGDSGFSQTEGDMHGNFVGEPKEINYGMSNDAINKLIQSYDNQILFLQKLIEEKDIIIKELRKRNEALKK